MDLTDEPLDGGGGDAVDDLLGAWALDAADPAELARVDAAVADALADSAVRAEADRLHEVAGRLAEPTSEAPPASLRGTALAAAFAARPPGTPVADAVAGPVEAYREQVEALAAVLATVPDDAWGAAVLPYPWTVHGLVAHVLSVERYTAGLVGLDGMADASWGPAHDHLGFAADLIDAVVAGEAPAATVAAWREAADAVLAAVDGVDLERRTALHGLPMSLRSVLAVRSFELWTHADDVRRALGRPVEAPTAPALRRMSTTVVTALPGLVLLTDAHDVVGRAHLVLTGPGGGTFDVALGGAGAASPEVTIVADVVDFCRLVARRIEPDELPMAVEGERSLVLPVLAAARAVTV